MAARIMISTSEDWRAILLALRFQKVKTRIQSSDSDDEYEPEPNSGEEDAVGNEVEA
ncbi:hypothetical protein BGX38DRAFT_1192294 [Terfezia claveryi]|nr:hypothetical protein BGX38DRAFT_1192294 [Terfezia claveryi]